MRCNDIVFGRLEIYFSSEVVLCETASDAAYTSIGTAILMVSRTRTV